MQDLLLIFTGAVLWALTNWIVKFSAAHRASMSKEQAQIILTKHGMNTELYMPSMGIDDGELRNALDILAPPVKVVLKNGELIGRLCPKMVSSKQTKLRLVVDND